MHLFVGSKTCQIVVNDEKVQGNRILLDSNVKHMVEPDHHCDFFLLIDHTSHVARQLRDNYLQPAPYCHMEGQMVEMPENMAELPEEEVIAGCPGGGIFRVSASCLQLQKIYRGVHQ